VEIELTPDQEFFIETTRKFLDERVPTSALRELRDSPEGYNRDYWRRGSDLGWTSLLVSEVDGGGSISGRGLCDLALVAFEFGRHAAPGPLLANNVVASTLSRSGSAEHKKVLAEILSGEITATWCYFEPRPNDRLGTVELEAARNGDGYVVHGQKTPVEAAGQAEQFLVTARSGDGLVQLLMPADAPGLTVTPLHSLDLTRRFGSVNFDEVMLPSSAVVGIGEPDVEHQIDIAGTIQLAEMVGAMERALEITTEWAFNRYSFGRPLASYQELKHRFADMRAWLEAGHAVADAAAREVDAQSVRSAEMVSVGKCFLGVYGPDLLQDCVQMHGGIGVTFDHDMHLFLRRVVQDSRLYGTVADHRQRLTTVLEQREAATNG
jgi:alkylation response protein AidB-like acyl-CoA dehydrogenase